MLLAPPPGDTGITINNVTTTGGRHEAQHFRSAHQEIRTPPRGWRSVVVEPGGIEPPSASLPQSVLHA